MTTWIVKQNGGYKEGWKEIKRFNNPGEADAWLTNHIKTNDLKYYDFTIKRMEA